MYYTSQQEIYIESNIQKREERVEKWAQKENKKYNNEELKVGDKVLVKNMKFNMLDIKGTIVSARDSILTWN